MRSFALDEIDALLRSGGAEDGESHGPGHLYCRRADPSARTVHEDRFGRARLCRVMQCVVRGTVGDPDACALGKSDFLRKRMHLFFQCECVFRVRAGEGLRSVDAVARLRFFHARADRFDDSCGVRARRVGKRWLDRVGACAHVGVVGIHTCGMDSDEDLSGGGFGRGDFLELQDFGAAEFTNEDGFHDFTPAKELALMRQRHAAAQTSLN